MLAYSIYTFPDGYSKVDELATALEALKWGSDLLVAATPNAQNFVAVVGNDTQDFDTYAPPELCKCAQQCKIAEPELGLHPSWCALVCSYLAFMPELSGRQWRQRVCRLPACTCMPGQPGEHSACMRQNLTARGAWCKHPSLWPLQGCLLPWCIMVKPHSRAALACCTCQHHALPTQMLSDTRVPAPVDTEVNPGPRPSVYINQANPGKCPIVMCVADGCHCAPSSGSHQVKPPLAACTFSCEQTGHIRPVIPSWPKRRVTG